jgi:hypothetical protein
VIVEIKGAFKRILTKEGNGNKQERKCALKGIW